MNNAIDETSCNIVHNSLTSFFFTACEVPEIISIKPNEIYYFSLIRIIGFFLIFFF